MKRLKQHRASRWSEMRRMAITDRRSHLLQRWLVEVVVGHCQGEDEFVFCAWDALTLRARNERSELDHSTVEANSHRHWVSPVVAQIGECNSY